MDSVQSRLFSENNALKAFIDAQLYYISLIIMKVNLLSDPFCKKNDRKINIKQYKNEEICFYFKSNITYDARRFHISILQISIQKDLANISLKRCFFSLI